MHLLRLVGLRREIELHEATEAYEKAKAIEKAVSQYVIDNNEYYINFADDLGIHGVSNGERITKGFDSFMINEDVFEKDFAPKVKEAFMILYGIDNPVDFVYSYPMSMRRLDAEKSYKMTAVDFLRICGRTEEAKEIEECVTGYLRPELEKRIMTLIKNFIEGGSING